MTTIGLVGRVALAATACIAGAIAATSESQAQSAEAFYKGKQINMSIGYPAGTAYDVYSRLLARHIADHIPGKPSLVAQNMPGAASLKAANYIYNVAPKDGTAFAGIGRAVPMVPLYGGEGAQFDPLQFTYLGSMNKDVSLTVSWYTSGVNTIQDAMDKELIVGGSAMGLDDSTVMPYVANKLIGTKFKIVTGYQGGNESLIAMERGEVNGRSGWSYASMIATRPDWWRDKKIIPIIQMGLEKHPDMPDVPLIMDYAKNDEDKKALELILASQYLGRPFIAPPGLPTGRAKALQDAFANSMKDPAFIADAAKAGVEVSLVDGDETLTLMKKFYASPKNVIARATEATPPIGK
jgi:tripartite-type tricarboxylate transporter receptor subunit TctC